MVGCMIGYVVCCIDRFLFMFAICVYVGDVCMRVSLAFFGNRFTFFALVSNPITVFACLQQPVHCF